MAIAIDAHGLGKQYRRGSTSGFRYGALRDVLAGLIARPFSRKQPEDALFWALKNVSFQVEVGEVVGIVGPNGAGKSTLLKVLARITEPTVGTARIRGRVGSLLEVGTGFHAELTGRENIFLSAAILGMKRREVRQKFDEIVSFAEVESFLDTPVKHYSTGMYLRLAFAVAAHLEPEVLLVDEVLAVGDASFQKKCLGKMGQVSQEGRTILFVSHNMTALKSLCSRAIWLSHGGTVCSGPADEVVARYLTENTWRRSEVDWTDGTGPRNDKAELLGARVVVANPEEPINVDTPFDIQVTYRNLIADAELSVNVFVYSMEEVCVFQAVSPPRRRALGIIRETCHIPGGLLNNETYQVRLLIARDGAVHLLWAPELISFEVTEGARKGQNWYGKWHGVVRPNLAWQSEEIK